MRTFTLSVFALSASVFGLPQAPGTPAYDCHANCGGAVTAGRAVAGDQSVLCGPNGEFVTQYTTCLACVAQPDLSYIWGIYGNSISANGASCGLAISPGGSAGTTTEPVSPNTPAQVGTTTEQAGLTTPAQVTTTSEAQPTTPAISTSADHSSHEEHTATVAATTGSTTPVATATELPTFTSGSEKSHRVLTHFGAVVTSLMIMRVLFF